MIDKKIKAFGNSEEVEKEIDNKKQQIKNKI